MLDRGAAVPLLLVGAGHMGGALISGWLASGALTAADLMIRDPSPGPAALKAVGEGAALNPADADLARARVVILAVKPQSWRAAAAALAPHLSPEAVLISIMAGVDAASVSEAFAGRTVARVMPTTAAAVGKGSACVWAVTQPVRDLCRSLFSALGDVVDLPAEDMIHLATAASGSAPAYVYALIEALQAAGEGQGLPSPAARALARGAVIGAAALLEATGSEAGELRRQVTSPAGTTEAALKVLQGDGALDALLDKAVAAAAARSRELAVQ